MAIGKRPLRRGRTIRPGVKIGAALGVLAVAAAGGVAVGLHYLGRSTLPPPRQPCATCLTDGFPLLPSGSPEMRVVETAIAKENAAVRADRTLPYVSIALLTPLTTGPNSDVTPTRMVDELRAAYLAQTEINAQRVLGIQLLLDDEGTSAEEKAGPAVRQLSTVAEHPDHVVAVAGLGVSVQPSADAARALAADHMPMFGSVVSADEFNGSQFNGLDQVVPDVSAQISELAAAIPPPHRAVLVYDEHANDQYTLNMRTDFTRYFAKALAGQQPQPFTPGVPDTQIEFQAIADAVCYTTGQPPAVLYAGRASVLASLLSHFKTAGNCAGRKITLITAGDGDGLAPAATAPAAGAGQVSVIYTDIVNLGRLTPAFRSSYGHTLSSLDPSGVGLADTWTIATYNAMQAAWTAIRTAYTATHPQLPTKEDVGGLVERLNQMYAPLGALGRFSLSADGHLLSPDIPIFEDAAGQRTTLRG